MPKLILGSGAIHSHCRIMFIGERPGREEYMDGRGFVGPAGQELWKRVARCIGIKRSETWVTNLVKTFSVKPPTPDEILRDAEILAREFIHVRPTLIVTIGYHAARALLPQFRDVTGDYFHGLTYPFTYGRLVPRTVPVVPCVHASAALREPDRYQNQFTDDLRAVRRTLHAVESNGRIPIPYHRTSVPRPYQCGLAGFGRDGQTIGLDTEGFLAREIECVAIARGMKDACVIETHGGRAPSRFLSGAIHAASTVAIHHAKHDVKALHQLDIHPRWRTIHDTMMQAYLLGLPQSLKVLAYRLFGFEMAEYEDLVTPIDDAHVRTVLKGVYEEGIQAQRAASRATAAADAHRRGGSTADRGRRSTACDGDAARVRNQSGRDAERDRRAPADEAQEEACAVGLEEKGVFGRTARRRAKGEARAQGAAQSQSQREGRSPDRHVQGQGRGTEARRQAESQGQSQAPQVEAEVVSEERESFRRLAASLPTRGLTSINSLLNKSVASGDSLRTRWSRSTFSPHVPLPPPPTWKDAPQLDRIRYVLTDAVAHLQVHQALYPKILTRGLDEVYALDRSVLPFLVRNEEIGMACDRRALKQLSKDFSRDFDRVCEKINHLAGREVNPLSAPSVSECLFNELGVTPTRETKSGKHYTTADKYLKARKLEHRIIPLILEARQLNKYRGTYTERLPKMLTKHVADDGRTSWRYHANWKYTRTATGRLAEEVILLIPKHGRTKDDIRPKQIRNCFHATDGHVLVSVDLSQIELRQMAHESRDRVMTDNFMRGIDAHARTAHELLGAPKKKEDQDDSLHRLPSKTFNFGIINGMTEYGMLDQLHEAGQLQWTIDDVRELLKEWFILHRGVRRWWDDQIAFCKEKGYVQDMFGRRRYISAIWSTDDRIVAGAERQTLMPIQAGADGISKKWNAKIWRRIILPYQKQRAYCEPWVRVHDDTTLEVDRRIAKDVKRQMLALVPQLLCVPTTAEGKSGTQWGDLH